MHNILWLNNTIPVICGGAWATKAGMLDNWRMEYKFLAALDAESADVWVPAVQYHIANTFMPPAQRLFWRTRLEPELVIWSHMSIFLPLLSPSMSPLSRWVPETKDKVLVSATSAEYSTP